MKVLSLENIKKVQVYTNMQQILPSMLFKMSRFVLNIFVLNINAELRVC